MPTKIQQFFTNIDRESAFIMISIRQFFCSVLLASSLSVVAQEQVKPKVPRGLMGEVDGERLTLFLLPEDAAPLTPKLKGSRFINVEPGCIMLEAYVKLIGRNKLEIHMPLDDGFTTRALKIMGVRSNRVLVTFEPSKVANQAGVIMAITPSGTKSSEQAEALKP